MTESTSFTIHLEQEQDFDFRVRFDWPGIPVSVEVVDAAGRTVHEQGKASVAVA